MPSPLHEAFVELFRNRPVLAAELLAESLSIPLPKFTEARLEPADLTEAIARELRADLLVLLLDGKPVLAILLEVQLSDDPDKLFTWPAYLAGARLRYRCPACVLVVAPEEALATRLAKPIPLGPGGSCLVPLVLGPEGIPVITELPVAEEKPELAVLSAIAHGRTEVGYEVARAALEGAGRIEDAERKALYRDFVLMSLNEATRKKLEEIMIKNWEFQTEPAKSLVAKGREEGLRPLVHVFERRLGRSITSDEHAKLMRALREQGADRLGDVVLDLSPEELARWLAA